MKLSIMAMVLWAAGSALNAALVVVLFYKGRWRAFPCFTAWMSFGLLYAAVCFVVYRVGSKETYRLVYWLGALCDFLLQIGVVWEIGRHVLAQDGRWVEGSRKRLFAFAVIAPVIAGVMAGFMKPAATSALNAWAARASLFSTILICFLFTSVVMTSQELGLGWRSHVVRESYGLFVWTLVAFVTDTLHAYWRTMHHFDALENMRIAAFQGCLVYWCVAFWFSEPKPTAPPETLLREFRKLRSGE